MKSIILIMSSLILGCHIYAQTIRGIVLSESGEPIPDALFKISDTYLKTYSDKNGCFEFKSLTPGIYIIMADCEGYEESFEKAIISDVDIELKFVLKKFDLSIHEVVISAVGAGNKTPVAYLNITKTEIDQSNNGQDIPYILGNTPSMVATSDAGTGIGYTSMRIRGTDMTRINITIDGIPLNDSESHEVWWVDMPDFSSSIENIQIQRGAGTSTNGSGAFGANINLQTNTLNKQAYSEINLLGGSYRTFKESFKGGSGLLNNSLIFDTRFSFVNSDGYIDRAKSKLNSYFISGTWFDNKNVLKINLIGGHEETYQAWSGVPKDSLRTNRTYNPNTYENEIDNYTQSHFQVFYIRKLTQNLNFDLTAHYTHGVGYYEQYKKDEEFKDYGLNNIVFGEDTVTKTDLIRRKWMDNDFIGTIYAFKYEKEKINILAGGSWNIYTGNHFGKILWAEYASNMNPDHQWYRNKGEKTDLNNYIKFNWFVLDALNIWVDIQYRSILYSIKGTHDDLRDISQNHFYRFINPKLGLSYLFDTKTGTYFSFAVGNREPSRTNFKDAGEREVILPETLYDFEAGIEHSSDEYLIKLNFYYMNYKNQLILTGEINDVGAYIMSNVPKSYRTGVELSGQLHFYKFMNWEFNTAFSRNIIKNLTVYVDNWDTSVQETEFYPQTSLSFSPAIVAGSELSFKFLKGFEAGLISKYVGKQFIDNTAHDDRSLNAYFVNNLRIRYNLHTKTIKEVVFDLFVNNFLNEIYESNAWVYRYYYGGRHNVSDGYFPQAGIHFMAGIRLRF